MTIKPKIKKQILFILLGIIFISSFYLIWKIIFKPTTPVLPEQKITFKEEAFVYFQIPAGKMVEDIILSKEAQEKTSDIKARIKKVRDMSEELKNLSEELKELTDACTCGNSSCQSVQCENGCCCQAEGCSAINTCSKPNGCLIESPGCDISSACPEAICDLENIGEKTDEMETLMDNIKEEQEKMLIAQLSIANDYLKLNQATIMISSSTEAIDYETFFNRKDLIQSENNKKVEIETFPGWPNPTIEKQGEIFFDPATIYFDEKEIENKNIIDISFRLELFIIMTNQSPRGIARIMDENAKEVLEKINFGELTPSTEKINEIMQKATEETISSFSADISQEMSEILSMEITNAIVEELKGNSGIESSLPVKLIEPMSIILLEELPEELKTIFSAEIKTKVSDIFSNTDLFPYKISNLLSERLKEFIPDDIRDISSKNIGDVLPGGLIELVNNNIINKLLDLELNRVVPEEILETINLTLSNFWPDKINQALSLGLKNSLWPELESFLSENIPETLGFLSADKEKLSANISNELEIKLSDIFYKKLEDELTLRQAEDFSSLLFSSGIIQKNIEESILKNFDLTLGQGIEKITKEISYNVSKEISLDMAFKITDLILIDMAKKVSQDLGNIIIPAISKSIEQGLFLNSLHELTVPSKLENDENGEQKLKISYPQNYQFMLSGTESSAKEEKLFEAHWETKIIYDAISEQINILNKAIKLIQSPEKGCNPDICSPQCIDATCYAQDFDCGEFQLTEFLGACSKYQTSYPNGTLPCQSIYVDFYDQNGRFSACPSIYSENELIKKYYLEIENAYKKINEILEKKYDQKSSEFKENIGKVVQGSKLLKDLSNELIQATNECTCSENSLCEKLSHGCEPKGCSISSQCSKTDLKNINEKIYDIEYAIQDIYYNAVYK